MATFHRIVDESGGDFVAKGIKCPMRSGNVSGEDARKRRRKKEKRGRTRARHGQSAVGATSVRRVK